MRDIKTLKEGTKFIINRAGELGTIISDSYGFVEYSTPTTEKIITEGYRVYIDTDSIYDRDEDIVQVLTKETNPEYYL